MGYCMSEKKFDAVLSNLSERYRLYAPVRKVGEGRFTDTDVIRYDFVNSLEEMELDQKSDYSFKEILTPLSQTLFFFTEDETKEADRDYSDVIVFLRSCDLHAVKRLDDIYLNNGFEDPFYKRMREHLHFALIGCSSSGKDCFCVDMGTSQAKEGYVFSMDRRDGEIFSDVKWEEMESIFAAAGGEKQEVVPAHVTENQVHVSVPDEIPLSIYSHPLWEEYTGRCINCGRCNFVCPTCTCFNMQDVFYTENGKVGERRRVAGSCMVNGYTTVAGGGQYRRKNGERMRFKVLHKISDHKKRFGENMCVGCGRCDMVCPEYISYSNIINKVNAAVQEEEK